MKNKIISFSFLLGLIAILSDCKKNDSIENLRKPILPEVSYNYGVVLPIGALDNAPANNKITNAGATLGRVLFYDKLLSINNQTSCASCHNQANAFAHATSLS